MVAAQVRLVLAAEPGCRVLGARPTADGYVVAFGRLAGPVPDETGAADLLLPD